MTGYIQIYTGNGKGKTTAAIGLAIRAIGAGKKVYMAQFLKGGTYSEITAVQNKLPEFEIEQFGREGFIRDQPTDEDIGKAKEGLSYISAIMASGRYDVMILDEIFVALYLGLIEEEALIDLLHQKPGSTEMILTGRYAPDSIIELADLVTEMKVVKHYYKQGVKARKGIES